MAHSPRVGVVTAVAVAILAGAALTDASQRSSGNGSGLVVGSAGLAVCYLVAPVVRWLWSRSRPRGAATWPDGAQAYAVLSVLPGPSGCTPTDWQFSPACPATGAMSGCARVQRVGSRPRLPGGRSSCGTPRSPRAAWPAWPGGMPS